MYCPNCGKKIPDDSKYCPACGKPVVQNVTSQKLVEENSAVRNAVNQNHSGQRFADQKTFEESSAHQNTESLKRDFSRNEDHVKKGNTVGGKAGIHNDVREKDVIPVFMIISAVFMIFGTFFPAAEDMVGLGMSFRIWSINGLLAFLGFALPLAMIVLTILQVNSYEIICGFLSFAVMNLEIASLIGVLTDEDITGGVPVAPASGTYIIAFAGYALGIFTYLKWKKITVSPEKAKEFLLS